MESISIRATNGSESIELSFPQDLDVYEWIEQLKLILLWATFPMDLIKEVLPTEDDLSVLEKKDL
jgi:hypothetical protein